MATDHQADDVVGTLLVQTVLVIIDSRYVLLPVAMFAQEPAARGLGQHAVGERIAQFEPGEDRERVGRVFLVSENRKCQLADEHVADFMDHGENDIADDELDAVAPALFSQVLEAMVVREFALGRIQACPEACLESWPGLLRCGRRTGLRESDARTQAEGDEPQAANTRILERDRKPSPGCHRAPDFVRCHPR